MSTTPNLILPYIAPAQAQKHVTHNEAIRTLDALVQIAVLDKDAAAPPAAPAHGDRYIVAAAPSGAWAGYAGAIAAFQDGAWAFYTPRQGWLAWVADEAKLYVYSGLAWTAYATGSPVNPAPLIGVNTTADAVNRLAVKSDAVLISHDDSTPGTGNVQLKLNKSAVAKTCSLMFQDAYSGRAEAGLTGDDNFHFKVSANGTTWFDAITIDKATGKAGFGAAGTPTNYLTVTNPANTSGYAEAARFNVWNNADGSAAMRVLLGQQYTNGFFVEVADLANVKGNWIFQPYGGKIALRTWRTIPSNVDVLLGGHTAPDVDNSLTLGTSSLRWGTIYCANGTISTSDAREKTITGQLDSFAGAFLDAVEPVLFRWTIGSIEQVKTGEHEIGKDGEGNPVMAPTVAEMARPGKRMHAGFLAQDIKAAIDRAGVDFGAWGLDDNQNPDSRQWVRPDQLIPVLWAAVRELRAKVARLELKAGA